MGLVSILTAFAASLGLPLGLLVGHLAREELHHGEPWFHILYNVLIGLIVGVALTGLGAPSVLAAMLAILVIFAVWLVHEIPDFWKTFTLAVLVMTAAQTNAFLPLASLAFLTMLILGTICLTHKDWVKHTVLSHGVFIGTAIVLGMIL
jgi:hypothetical protein